MSQNIKSLDSVGQLIEQSIATSQLSQKTVAIITGIAPASLNRMIKGTKPIDAMTALRLQEALGLNAQTLLYAQAEKALCDAQEKFTSQKKSIDQVKKILSIAPVPEMVNRSWLGGVRPEDLDGSNRGVWERIEKKLQDFYGVKDLEEIRGKVSAAAKKTKEEDPFTPDQIAWIGRSRQVARTVIISRKFNSEYKEELLNQLKGFLVLPRDVLKVSALLAKFGVRLVFVEGLKSTKIDGACTWLSDNAPVIAMSLRYDRIDNFWFILRHELEHVFQGDGKERTAIDSVNSMQLCEDKANCSYANFIDPNSEIERYLGQGIRSEVEMCSLAKKLGIHTGLVAGRVQFLTKQYALFRKHLVPVRSYFLSKRQGNVDGWGIPCAITQGDSV